MRVIEIQTSSGAKVAQLSGAECSAIVDRKLNGTYSIQLTYPVDPKNDKSDFLIEDYRLRVYDPDTGAYQVFIISQIEQSRTERGSIVYQVSGDHISIAKMSKEIVNGFYDFKQETPSNIMTKIMAGSSSFTKGSIVPTRLVDITIGYESVLSAIVRLCEALKCYYDIDEPNGQVDLVTSVGTNNYVRVEPKRNLKSLTRSIHTAEILNKLYASGAGEPPVTLADTPHRIKSVSGALVTFEGNKVVPQNDIWNTNFKLKALNGADAGTSWTINDCSHGTTDDTITLASSPSGLAAGDLAYIVTSAGAAVDYIPYGAADKAGIIRSGDKQDNTNFIKTAMLDGTYSSGVCANWSSYGGTAPTLTENTNSAYIKYGQKSQKIVTTVKTTGVRQYVNHNRTNEVWSAVVNVYVVSGSVVLALQADTDYGYLIATQTAGWQTLTLKNVFDTGAGLYLYVLAGTDASEFYLDSAWLMNSKEPKRFVDGSEKKTMWVEAFDKLMESKDGRTTYQCNFVDLNRWSPARYPFDRVNLGDTVRVIDELLAIDIEQTVVEVRDNIFQPELTETVISNENT